MANDDSDLYPSTMDEDVIVENDYETAVVNIQDENTFSDYENNEIVEEFYETNLNIEHSYNVWCEKSVRSLIHLQNQLSKQLKICPNLKKKSLWQHVSEHMIEQGFYFDAKTCETKWHDLKKVYMYNKTYFNVDEDNNVGGNDLRESPYDDCVTSVAKCENVKTIDERDNIKISDWTIKSTRNLIQMYSKYRKKFSAVNQQKKHLLWKEISQQFLQLGYNYSANSCHEKWHNLKKTFKQNKQRASKYGPKFNKWIYYKDINKVIRNLPKQNLNNVSITSSNDDKSIDVKKENEYQFNTITKTNLQMLDSEIIKNNNGEKNASSLEIWTDAATKCLIKSCSLYPRHLLMTTNGKKRFLWNEISDRLCKNGHTYSGLACSRKWCFLKTKYLKLKKLGIISVKWHYYQDLDRLLGAPIKAISWSVDSTNCLIDCVYYYKDKLMNVSKREKLMIWKQISEKMSQNGFHYSSKTCYNKWLTLKNSYIKNKMRFNRNKKVIWIYYNKIDSVLRGINRKKNSRSNDSNLNDINYLKTEVITELKGIISSNYTELIQKFKEMEDNLGRREKLFIDIGLRTLNALDKLNEFETNLLKLLELLILKLPNATVPQI